MSSELIVATASFDADIATWYNCNEFANRSFSFRDATRFHSITNHFKNNVSDPHSVCAIGSDHIASCQKTSARVRIWPRSKGACVESQLPEKCSSLISSLDGMLLFAGGKSGRIHVWELSTGSLLHSWQAHYKTVSILKMDLTGTVLISSSEDSMIHLWLLPDILDPAPNQSISPFQSWSGHTLPVTDFEALSSLNELLVVSVSLDCTCQIWSVINKGQLKGILLPCPILSVTVDRGQCAIFCGGQNGKIYESSLVKIPTNDRHYETWDHSHSQSVTCLVITLTSERLVSGSLDGTIKVWDIGSKQCLNTMEFPGKKPVSNVLVLLCPARNSKQEEAPLVMKITGLSKFPKYPENDKESWNDVPVLLSGQIKYRGIAHQFLNPSTPVPSYDARTGTVENKHQDDKLMLDVSQEDASMNVSHVASNETSPDNLRALIQQILQQDRNCE